MLDLGPGARVVFAGAWIALQASLVLSAAWRPDGAFGFRMFPEASTIEVHLERDVGGTFVPVTSGGWSARDAAGQLRHFAWRDRVRDPVLSRLDVRAFAAYGADAQLARLQRALVDVSDHLPEDAETRRLRAVVRVERNGRAPPETVTLLGPARALP